MSLYEIVIAQSPRRDKDLRAVTSITTLPPAAWRPDASRAASSGAAAALEHGDVLFLPDRRFEVTGRELQNFSPGVVGSSKNVGFDPMTGTIGGTVLAGDDRRALGAMLARFSSQASALVDQVLPAYRGRLERGRTSFRPVEIAGRATTWRKDDTRLHVDSFPATPVHGRRILRVFANVNPEGRARVWRVGEGFEHVSERFAARLRAPLPGTGTLLKWLRVTKTRRSSYDALMLQLHDRMKADTIYQTEAPQTAVEFPAGSTWIAFTDQVSHAAMAGQYQLEQTFLLPVDAMLDEQRSPLRVLERLKGRALV